MAKTFTGELDRYRDDEWYKRFIDRLLFDLEVAEIERRQIVDDLREQRHKRETRR